MGINQVIINKYEINGYDDSDFFAVVLDRVNKTVSSIMYGTTRGHIDSDVLQGFDENKTSADIELAKKIIIESIHKNINPHGDVRKLDAVRIVRGRKYPKGTEFVVTGFSAYRDRYGRVQTEYLHSECGMKVPAHNVELIGKGAVSEEYALSDLIRA